MDDSRRVTAKETIVRRAIAACVALPWTNAHGAVLIEINRFIGLLRRDWTSRNRSWLLRESAFAIGRPGRSWRRTPVRRARRDDIWVSLTVHRCLVQMPFAFGFPCYLGGGMLVGTVVTEDWMQRTIITVAALCLTVGSAGASAQSQSTAQLANPASVRCLERGGMLRMERRPDGGEYGVCLFADNYQCEEWAMFRGECPVGGLRVTGYVTQAARYCAITGGRYTVLAKSGAADEEGACVLPGGKACGAEAYFAGTCGR
jgi:putative hemolysin